MAVAVGPRGWHGGIETARSSQPRCSGWIAMELRVVCQVVARTCKENRMNVLKWAVVLWIAVLALLTGASALVSAAPDAQGDVTYLQLLDQNGVSYPNPEAMVSFAHDLVDELSASAQDD